MSKRPLQLDVLANAAESWHDTTSAMISVTAGMILRRLQVTSVEIALGDITPFLARYEVDRTYRTDENDVVHMRITIKERGDDTTTTQETAAGLADQRGAGTSPVVGDTGDAYTPGTNER